MNVRPTTMIDEMVAFLKKEYNTDVMEKRRLESVVVPRAALFNVCRGYYSATTLGKYFGKNHATILHHYKNHDALMLVPQYRESFNALTEILTKYDERARLNKETAESIIDFLRMENESLKQKLQAYEEVNS
mgnify:FL=1